MRNEYATSFPTIFVYFGPGNGSRSATNVVLVVLVVLVLVLGVVVIDPLKLFHFTILRRQASHTD